MANYFDLTGKNAIIIGGAGGLKHLLRLAQMLQLLPVQKQNCRQLVKS